MRLDDNKKNLIAALRAKFGNTVTRKQVMAFVTDSKLEKPRWLFNNKDFRAGRGTYDLSKVSGVTAAVTQQVAA
jgi:hypothetical protein